MPSDSNQPENHQSPAETGLATVPQEAHRDTLRELVAQKLPAEKKRIRGKTYENVEQLKREIHGTVMPLMTQMANELFHLRQWAAQQNAEHTDAINDLSDRQVVIEDMLFGGDSQLTAEDAQLFSKIVFALDGFLQEAKPVDPQGKAQIDEMKSLCEQAKARIAEIEVSVDESDSDDEG